MPQRTLLFSCAQSITVPHRDNKLEVSLRATYPSSREFQSSQVRDVASTSWVLWSVSISLGGGVPVISYLSCIPVLTLCSSRFLVSSASSCALSRCGGLLRGALYKRKAMKDRRATSRVPNEMPTPMLVFADPERPAADADGDVEVGVEPDVVDVNMVV